MKAYALKKRKNRLAALLFAFVFLIGLTVAAYPFFSDWYNQRIQDKLITEHDNTVVAANPEVLEAERDAARAYNEGLLRGVVLRDPFDPEAVRETTAEYTERLSIIGDGIMGYLDIPKIDVRLAIFHGTAAEVLEKGVGHLENTSLPVGGTGAHAVLSAHTAYAKAAMFNDLIKLKEGDQFVLTVLDEKLAYEVIKIKVVDPGDTSDLVIDREQDYVTLVTCTPYGINSHRLLVKGTRVPYVEEAVIQMREESNYWTYLTVAAAVLMLIVVIVIVRRGRRRQRNRHET